MKTLTKIIDDYVYETTNENGNKVCIDMRDDHEKDSHSPMELILGAISGCVAVEIVSMMKKRRKTVIDFEIETTGSRKEEPPRGFTHIHSKYILTSPDAKQEELEKVSKLALDKYCSVANSLNAEIDFSTEIKRP